MNVGRDLPVVLLVEVAQRDLVGRSWLRLSTDSLHATSTTPSASSPGVESLNLVASWCASGVARPSSRLRQVSSCRLLFDPFYDSLRRSRKVARPSSSKAFRSSACVFMTIGPGPSTLPVPEAVVEHQQEADAVLADLDHNLALVWPAITEGDPKRDGSS